MTASIKDTVALPGDPALDCHLTGLRLTSVVTSEDSGHDCEAMLLFDTSAASGWWADAQTGEKVSPDSVTSLEIVFGVDLAPGWEHLGGFMLDRLRSWADLGFTVEMTSAPGKWTFLRSPADGVPIPRKWPAGDLQ